MKVPPIPENEDARLKELNDYQILDTAAEGGFDDITHLASSICGTKISAISLVDENRQWFKSIVGLNATETTKDIAFCAHAINEPKKVMEIEDAESDDRFKNNPLVTGDPHIRFYAGAPLVTKKGLALGTLCVIDSEPKKLSDDQRKSLKILANQVVSQLELRKSVSQLRFTKFSFEGSNEGIAWVNSNGKVVFHNARYSEITGIKPEELRINKIWEFDKYINSIEKWKAHWVELKNSKSKTLETILTGLDGKERNIELRLSFIAYGGESFIYAFCIDISDRKKTEENLKSNLSLIESRGYELKKTADLLEQVQGIAQIGHWEADLVQNKLYWSDETRKIHEVSDSYIPTLEEGINFYDKKSKPIITQAVEKAIKEGSGWDTQLRIISAKGNPKHVRAVGKAFLENGKPSKIFGVFQDISEEVELRESIKKREEQYRLLSENAKDLVCMHNTNGDFAYTSPSITDMLGYHDTEIVGKNPNEFFHPDDKERIRSGAFKETVIDAKSAYTEFRMRKKDGSYMWVESVSKPIIQNKKVIGIHTTTRDISNRKKIEQEVKKNEANLHALIENTTDIIWSLDRNYKLINFNKAFEKSTILQTGVKPKEGLKLDLEYYSEVASSYWKKLYDRVFMGMRFVEQSHITINEEVHTFEFFFNPIKNDKNEIIGAAVFGRDITSKYRESKKRKKFREGLKLINHLASSTQIPFEEFMKAALEVVGGFLEMPLGIISKIGGDHLYTVKYFHSTDKDIQLEPGQTFNLQDTYCDLTYTQKDVVAIDDMGSSPYSGHPCYSNFKLESYIGSIIYVNHEKYGTINFSSPHARKKPFDGYDSEFMNLLANLVGSVIERNRNESQLKIAKENAEAATEAKANFLSTMSHEIRTPLNGIIGTSILLLSKNPKPEQIEYLQMLKRSGDHLLSIVNDILDFSKIEESSLELEKIDFNLHEVTRSIANLATIQAQEKGVELNFNYDKKLYSHYEGDPTRVSQILNNFVSNALKFTKKGSITINITLEDRLPRKDKILFEVVDTGIGIKPDKQKQIFHKFAQADTSITRKFGGTGLGLAICTHLLEMMDSEIKLDSTYKKGSRFAFELTLPSIDYKEEKEFREEVFSEEKDLTSRRILLVEDNKFNILIAKDFLTTWGAQVVTAEDGQEAIDKIQDKSFDLVLMDLQMPNVDGYEATRRIRELKDPYFTKVPIIALTASAFISVKEKVIENGMNDFITKPIVPEEFYKKVKEYTLEKLATPETVEEESISMDYINLVSNGKQEMVIHYLELFAQSMSDDMDHLEKIIEKKQLEEIPKIAHKTKSSLKSLGLDLLTEKAIELEKIISKSSANKYLMLASSYLGDVRKAVANITTVKEELQKKN